MDKINMLSDKDILSTLGEAERFDETFLRLLLVELLTRIRKLEQINFALQAQLISKGAIDQGELQETIKNAVEYFNQKDERKSAFNHMLNESGITFEQWISYSLDGRFNDL